MTHRRRLPRLRSIGIPAGAGVSGLAAYDPFEDDYSAAGEASYAAANPGYQAASSTTVTASAASGGSIQDTIASILGAGTQVVRDYIAKRTAPKPSGTAPSTSYVRTIAVPTAAPSGMSPTTRNLLIAGAVVVGGVVVFSMIRRRRSNPARRRR
jgi:hypothetical protein